MVKEEPNIASYRRNWLSIVTENGTWRNQTEFQLCPSFQHEHRPVCPLSKSVCHCKIGKCAACLDWVRVGLAMRQLPRKVSSTRPDTANAQWMVVVIVLARLLIICSDFRAIGLNVTAWLSLPDHFLFFHGCAWEFASVNAVSPEWSWRMTHHRTHGLEPVLFDGHYVSWPSVFS